MANVPHIEHDGVICGITDRAFHVLLHTVSACGSCEAKKSCPVFEMGSEKIIDVVKGETAHSIGDPVTVMLEPSQGLRAVFFGYVLPFVFVFCVLIIGSHYFHHEVIFGLLALAVLVPYYTALYCLRDRIKKMFVFQLKDDM